MFAIPYEEDFTLIIQPMLIILIRAKTRMLCRKEAYLLNFANQYFAAEVTAEDVVWMLRCARFMMMGPVQPPRPRVITCCGWIAAPVGQC